MIPEGTRPMLELRDEIGAEALWRQLESGAMVALHLDSRSGNLHTISREQWRRTLSGMDYHWSRGAPQRSALDLLTVGNLSWLYSGSGMIRHQVGDDPVLVRVEQSKGHQSPPSNKGGAPEKADWKAIEEAFLAEVAKRGIPDELNEVGWQRQADVERWISSLKEVMVGESTIRKRAKQFLEKAHEAVRKEG